MPPVGASEALLVEHRSCHQEEGEPDPGFGEFLNQGGGSVRGWATHGPEGPCTGPRPVCGWVVQAR